jgi:hypothetical protein
MYSGQEGDPLVFLWLSNQWALKRVGYKHINVENADTCNSRRKTSILRIYRVARKSLNNKRNMLNIECQMSLPYPA